MNDNPAVAKLETLLTAKQFSDAYDLCVALVGSDPSSLDGWWGMTRAAKALGRWDEAKNAAKETIGLVPRWPVIWGEYGFIHEMLGQDDQARKAYEAGIKLDSNYAYGHSRLLLLCKKVNDRAGVISHGQALERSGFAGADVLDSVANAFWYNANFHMSLHYFKKSANLEPQAFRYSNVGLVYERPELNQSLDAVDAYRRALALNGTHEPALNGKRRTSEKLLKTAQELARLGQDVKEKDNFFQFYINPFMLLGIESGTLKESVTIAFIQKRKKALVQELELEDGWVETISHHLDKSRALSVCDDLLDDQKRAFHWLVFNDWRLCYFLQYGDIRLFTYDETYFPIETLNALDNSDFLDWLSGPFSSQFAIELSRAIEQEKLPLVAALLSGHRYVNLQSEDLCFAGTRPLMTAFARKPGTANRFGPGAGDSVH